ncbi:TPA: RNA-directed DNA polymerase [Acinetobacter baumannii]|nr:RNA-directed DNA polymerase [Acinetobacter baumannii]
MTGIYRLKNIGLPVIKNIDDLAHFTRLSSTKLNYLSNSSKFLYKVYALPKKGSGIRIIAQPSRELKAVQAWILRNILDRLSSSDCSKGFEIGSSILDNAKPHIGSNYILNIDLKNFFPSISANKVYSVFSSLGYEKKVCILLTNFCVYNGFLPQGAPTSPKLANLICSKLDSRIQGYTGPRGLTYTRYADDITISANTIKKIINARDFLETIINSENLSVNKNKTQISGVRKAKKVTGLIVNQANVGIGRGRYREIRAEIHYVYLNKKTNLHRINGHLAFVYSVDKKMYNKLVAYLNKLIEKNPHCLLKDLNIFKNLIKK